jgi:hypothetical protein
MNKEFGNLGQGDNGLPQPVRPGSGKLYELTIHPSAHGVPRETLATFRNMNRLIRANHERWAENYADHVTNSHAAILGTADRALSRTPADKRKRALILGSGNCLDIPLAELTDRFDEVTLVELDHESTEQAVRDLPPANQSKVKIVAADITGIVGEFADKINPTLALPIRDFLGRAAEVTQQIDVSNRDLELGEDYTFVCSQLVMTQLASLPNQFLRDAVNKRYDVHLSAQPGGDDHELFMGIQYLKIMLEIEHIRNLARLAAGDGTVHLADTYAELPPTPVTDRSQLLPMVVTELIDPVIAQEFIKVDQEPEYWIWDNEPGKRRFYVMAHSLDPKPKEGVI